MIDGYFIGKTGKRYDYEEIAKLIRKNAPGTLGKHIAVQLEAIGLLEEMEGGSTPCGLPFTFASEPVQKKLTSTAMVHTPGLFRAMQNDYAFRGASRQRAIHILSTVYDIAEEEAKKLLSGRLKAEIDEEAGTVSYIISA